MVCPRCISSVEQIFTSLGISFQKVSLGEIVLNKPISDPVLAQLEANLNKVGFELLQDRNSKIVNQIKSFILEMVYNPEVGKTLNLSEKLSVELPFEYTYLSHLFSITEGISIQEFVNRIRIERVKELLEYQELNISEISQLLGFSNVAHLSSQFKKRTGESPSAFKSRYQKKRDSLDSL